MPSVREKSRSRHPLQVDARKEPAEPGSILTLTADVIEVESHIDRVRRSTTGAIVTFLGVVRDDGIESIEIEACEEVANQDLVDIRDETVRTYHLQEVTIIHRTGRLRVGENILLIVVSAGHRREAFEGCEYILERIKERVPIWKKEFTMEGKRWVKGNLE